MIRKTHSTQVTFEARNLPGASQGASSTAEFYFNNSDGTRAILSIPMKDIKRRPFKVRAWGRVQGAAGTTPDFNVLLDAGNDATNTNNTTIFTTGSIVLDNDTTVMSWYIEAVLLLTDSATRKLQGIGNGFVNNTAAAQAVSTESVEDTGDVLFFQVAGQFSESLAGHGAFCDGLECVSELPGV